MQPALDLPDEMHLSLGALADLEGDRRLRDPVRKRYLVAARVNQPNESVLQASAPNPMNDPINTVAELYRLILGREPDNVGLDYHSQLLRDTRNILDVVSALTKSSEFSARSTDNILSHDSRRELKIPQITDPITIVDLGAQRLSDQIHAYAPLETAGYSTQVIGFEPLSERLEDRLIAEADSQLQMLPHFIGDGSLRTFYINNYDATSSLLPFNNELTQQFVELHSLKTIRTEDASTRRLDDVLPELKRIDFLKLDIQGFELHALQNALKTLSRTLVVHCEVSFAEIYTDQCYFSEVEILLREQGFALIDLIHQHRGGYIVPSQNVCGDRLLWADAVFFKEAVKLSPDERAVQAIIAYHVYGKPALAEKLISIE